MGAEEKRLCEKCHERLTTLFYICDANTGESHALCEKCYQQTASLDEMAYFEQLKGAIRNGKCRYCGKPAVSGSGVFASDLAEPQFSFDKLACKQCGLDLAEFHKMPENVLPNVVIPFGDKAAKERRLKQLTELEKRMVGFMKQRISERK
jgi:hypothetical protein